MSLKYGLNIKSSKTHISKGIQLGAKRTKNPLLDDAESDQDNVSITKGNDSHRAVINKELKVAHLKAAIKGKELQEKALDEDPTVYDYDEVYDDLKREEIYKKHMKDGVTADGKRKAKYMENLISNSNKRKIYLEQAKQKKLQKERELESEQFADKEEFVTEAYLDKQAELKRLEEEEKLKEGTSFLTVEREMDPNRERDVAGFYRVLMDSRSKSSKRLTTEEIKALDKERSLAESTSKIESIQKPHAHLNESGEVIDKRELLTGGLNLTYKAVQRKQQEAEAARILEEKSNKEIQKKHIEQQDRQKRYIEQQQRVTLARQEAEKNAKEQELKEKLASKVATSTVMSAKERYLQRKQQQMANKNGTDI